MWDNLLPSPSGKLLAFNSYPPDNYISEALWVAKLPTRQVRQVTWESSTVYGHLPVEWKENEGSLVFWRYVHGKDEGYYKLTLPEDLWDEPEE